MTKYNYKEIIDYFELRLNTAAPKEDIQNGEVELLIDQYHILLSKDRFEGSFQIEIDLGFFLVHPQEFQLHQLAMSNFLGINTGGCSLILDESGTALSLKCCTTPGTSPQENWEWLHRMISIAQEWEKVLNMWEEFFPINVRQKNAKN